MTVDERANPLERAGLQRRKCHAHVRSTGHWTEQGIINVKETVERADGGAELARNKYGASLKQACWTAGPYDMVTIFEAPDEETLGAQLLEICSLGNIKMTTLRGYDREEMSGILQKLS